MNQQSASDRIANFMNVHFSRAQNVRGVRLRSFAHATPRLAQNNLGAPKPRRTCRACQSDIALPLVWRSQRSMGSTMIPNIRTAP